MESSRLECVKMSKTDSEIPEIMLQHMDSITFQKYIIYVRLHSFTLNECVTFTGQMTTDYFPMI